MRISLHGSPIWFFGAVLVWLLGVCTAAAAAPLIIAHRGASGYRPEHTLAAYELAIDQGADYIEPDLVATKDGVLIARHENEISTTSDIALRFGERKSKKQIDGQFSEGWFSEDFTLAELQKVRARERLAALRGQQYDGQFGIPTLQEILNLVRRKSRELARPIGVYLELKHPTYFASIGLPLEERLLRVLKEHGFTRPTDPLFIECFEPTSLRKLRRLTALPLIQLIDEAGQPYDFVVAGDRRGFLDLVTPAGLAEIAGYANGIGPHKRLIIPADAQGRLQAPTSLIRDAHARKLLVHPWTFRKEAQFLAADYRGDAVAEMEQFYRLGVDGLFSDFPDLAVRARDRAEQRIK